MPKKRRSSIKAGKKKPVVQKKEKITKKESLSSITSEEASEAEVEEIKEAENVSMEEESQEIDEEEAQRISEKFDVKLQEQFDSFEGFVTFMEPVVSKVEQIIEAKDKTRSQNRVEIADPSKIFNFFGALLKQILIPEFSHDNLVLSLYKIEDESGNVDEGANFKEHVREDFLNLIKKRKVKTLEKSKLRFNIERNDTLDVHGKLDEEELHPILLELIQRYETALEGLSDLPYRRTYFESLASKEDKSKQKGKAKTAKKNTRPKKIPVKEKIKKLMEDLQEVFGKAHDLEVEPERTGKGKKNSNKLTSTLIGGSYEIVAEQEDKKDDMDEETIESNAQEQELRERLLEEYNNPDDFIKKGDDGSIKFTSKLLENEKINNTSIYSVLLASIVFGRRVARVSKDLSDPATIRDLIQAAKFIPFPLEIPVKTLQTKLVIAKAIDIILAHELQNCLPLSAYQKVSKRFKEETHEMNQSALKLCPHLCKIYQLENCILSTETYQKLELYRQQLDILVTTYKYFVEDIGNQKSTPTAKAIKVPLSKIEVLFADAKQISGMNEYNEFDFLKNEVRQAQKSDKEQKPDEDAMEEEKDDAKKKKGGFFFRSLTVNLQDPPKTRSKNKMQDEEPEEASDEETTPQIVSSKDASKDLKPTLKKNSPSKARVPVKKDQAVRITEPEKKKYQPEELKRKLEQLKQKMTIEQAEEKFNELEEDPEASQADLDALKDKIRRTKDWHYRYKEAIILENRNLSKVDDLIDDLDNVEIQIREMEELLEKVTSYRSWKDRFDEALQSLKKAWKTPGKDMEIETNGQNERTEMLTLQELNEILQDSNDLQLDKNEEAKLKELRIKAIQARNLQDKIVENLPNVFDVKILTSYENEINNLKIKLPQLETIQMRKQLNEQLLDLLHEHTTIEQIDEFMSSVSHKLAEIDKDNYNKLVRKFTEASTLRSRVNEITQSQSNIEYEDINKIRELIKQIKEFRISLGETEKLNNILQTYAWLLSLHAMIDEDVEKATNYKQLLTNKLYFALPHFNVDESVAFCQKFLEDKANNEQRFANLKDTIESGESIRFTDRRVEQLFNDYYSQLWMDESENFFSRKRTSRELERFFQEGPKDVIEKIDPTTVERLRHELEKVKEWKRLFDETVENNIDTYLRWKFEKELKDPTQGHKILALESKLSVLNAKFTDDLAKYSDLEKCHLLVQKYLNWVSWCLRVEAHANNVDNGLKIVSFAVLKELHSDIAKFDIPKNLDLCKRVENWYNIAVDLLKEYLEKFGKEEIVIGGEHDFTKGVEKDSVRKIADKLWRRPTLAEAIRLKKDLETKTSFLSFAKEIENLEHAIQEYEHWVPRLIQFVNNDGQRLLESANKNDDLLEDREQIGKHISELKQEFSQLKLRCEEDEFKLVSAEWQYRAYMLIKKQNTDASVDEWKHLINESIKYPHIDPTPEKILTKFLRDEKQNSEKYHKIVRALKNKEKTAEVRSPEDVEKILLDLHNGLIKYPDDEKFLDGLLLNCKKLVTRAHNLLSGTEKEPLSEFNKTLDLIKRFSVPLKNEEEKLEKLITDANKLASAVRKGSNMDLVNLDKLLLEYKDCPVAIPEAEKFRDNYEESKKTYQILQMELQQITETTISSFEEYQALSERLNAIKWDHDGQLNFAKMQVYVPKIQVLQQLSKNDSGVLTPITIQTLKSLAAEGKNLKKHILEDKKLDEVVFWIENLFRKAEEKVRALNSVKSIEDLNRIPTIVLGIIDYTSEINKRKATLTVSTSDVLPQNQMKQKAADISKSKSPSKAAQRDSKKSKKDEKKTEAEPIIKKKTGARAKPSDPIGMLKEILEYNNNIIISGKEARDCAEHLVKSFKLEVKGSDKCAKFASLFKNILKYPNIAKDLYKKKFDVKDVQYLIKITDNTTLLSIDRKLGDPKKKKVLKQSQPDEPEPNKKVRSEESTKNMLEYSNPISQVQSRASSKSGPHRDLLRNSDAMEPKAQRSRDNRQFREDRMYYREERKSFSPHSQRMEIEGRTGQAKGAQHFSDEDIDYEDTLTNNLSLAESKEIIHNRKKGPILYDPDKSDYEDDAQRKNASKQRGQNLSKIPNPAFKIFDGVLKPQDENIRAKVKIYSYNSLQTIKEVPQIIDEKVDRIKLQRKMSMQKFAPYLNKILNAHNDHPHYILTGWVEAETPDFQAVLERIAQNYSETNHVGVIEYLDCAKVYFLHREQIPNEWARRLNFKIRKIHKLNPIALLAFILIYKPYKSSVDVSIIKKIIPEAVPSFPEADYDERDSAGHGRSNNNRHDSLLSGPQTPEASVYGENSRAEGSKAPVFNIRPEFANMDSNSYNNRRRGNNSSRFLQNRSPHSSRGQQRQDELYEEEMNPQQFRPQSQSNFPRSNEQSNSRGRFEGSNSQAFSNRESSLEPGEVRSGGRAFTNTRAPNQSLSPHNEQPNPFYLEYLKNKSNQTTLASSPIAQRYLGASPNPSSQRQSRYSQQSQRGFGRGAGGSNFQRPQNEHFHRGNFNQNQRSNQGGFAYSNQANSNRYQKPGYQNVYKNQWQ